MKHFLFALYTLSMILLGGCASTGGGSSEAPMITAASGQADGRLLAGRALFSARCQRCHALPNPNRLTPEKWPAQITEMSRKSGLSSDQIALVTDYLVAASRARN